jgi:hypothetical protein
MKTARSTFIGALLLSLSVTSAWSDINHQARPGSINYVEGQASIGPQVLNAASVGAVELGVGQTLTTQTGKVEILLTPGVFLRVAENSSVKMISPGLANTEAELGNGRAIVEAIDVHKENSIRIDHNGGIVTILKNGLYEFDADQGQARTFNGEADVRYQDQDIKLKEKHTVTIAATAALKAQSFEPRTYEDEFYRWSALRSAYLSEASVDTARTYLGVGPAWYGPGWVGRGWYWNSWFGVYTFLPADGIFWSPFGWGFYSPVWVYRSPFFYGPHFGHRFEEFHGPYGHGYGRPRGGFPR